LDEMKNNLRCFSPNFNSHPTYFIDFTKIVFSNLHLTQHNLAVKTEDINCAFSALTLLNGHQEEHPACKN